MSKSRDSVKSGKMQNKLQAEHSANNAFVKAEQAKLQKYGMKKSVSIGAEYSKFDAAMMNNEDCVHDAVKALTKGIDDAYPVK